MPKRRIASHYGVTERAVRYHLEHLPALLALARDAERAARADSLDRIEALQRRIEEFLTRVEHTDNYSATLGAFREMRSNLELIGEVRKLDRAGTINLELTVEWQEVKAVLVNTLASTLRHSKRCLMPLRRPLMGISEDLKAALCPKPCRRGPSPRASIGSCRTAPWRSPASPHRRSAMAVPNAEPMGRFTSRCCSVSPDRRRVGSCGHRKRRRHGNSPGRLR